MRLWLMVGAVALASPVMAQSPSSVTGCEHTPQGNGFFDVVVCDITNLSDQPIATVRYSWRAIEKGRTVPWSVGPSSGSPDLVPVPGGIEPGETVQIAFSVDPLPSRADASRVGWEVALLEVFNVDEVAIE